MVSAVARSLRESCASQQPDDEEAKEKWTPPQELFFFIPSSRGITIRVFFLASSDNMITLQQPNSTSFALRSYAYD